MVNGLTAQLGLAGRFVQLVIVGPESLISR
jgi:hypothetical protein